MDISYLDIERRVLERFPTEPLRYGTLFKNPVTGAEFCWGADPVATQIGEAVRATRAREWFYRAGPCDAPQLPLSWAEIEAMRFREDDPLCHIVAHFAGSLRRQHWDYENHPSFEEYTRGVLASEHTPEFVKADEELRKKYPPRPLRGLGRGLCWEHDREKHHGVAV